MFIKGPSGSGKSTLLGLLAGIQTANHGTLEVLGQPLARLSGRARDHFRAANLGYIFQQFNLLPFSRCWTTSPPPSPSPPKSAPACRGARNRRRAAC